MLISHCPQGGGGVDTSDATATASEILAGYTAYTGAGKVTGEFDIDAFIRDMFYEAGIDFTLGRVTLGEGFGSAPLPLSTDDLANVKIIAFIDITDETLFLSSYRWRADLEIIEPIFNFDDFEFSVDYTNKTVSINNRFANPTAKELIAIYFM